MTEGRATERPQTGGGTTPGEGAAPRATGPDVQQLGRWATLGVVAAVAAIFVVLILSAMR